MSEPASGRRLLGQVLKDRGVIKESQVQAALGEQRRHGGLIGQCLVTMGACAESDVAMALAVQAGLEAVDLSQVAPESEALEAVDGWRPTPTECCPCAWRGGRWWSHSPTP